MTKNDENSVKMKNQLNSDCRLSVLTMTEHPSLSKTIVNEMVTENLRTRKAYAKSVLEMFDR